MHVRFGDERLDLQGQGLSVLPPQESVVHLFVSSSSEPHAQRMREFMKALEDSLNPPLRPYKTRIAVEMWENELPSDAETGETNLTNVELAKMCQHVCVLLFDWVGPGTAQEVAAVLAIPKPQRPKVSVFKFTGGRSDQPRPDWVSTSDFLGRYRDELAWSQEIDATTDECLVKLVQPVFAAALSGAGPKPTATEHDDVY